MSSTKLCAGHSQIARLIAMTIYLYLFVDHLSCLAARALPRNKNVDERTPFTLTSRIFGLGEPILKVKCQSRGDSMVRSDSGELLLQQRLISFAPTKMRTRQGEIHGICTIRTDPPGYKWVSCDKESNGTYFTGNWDSPIPINPVEAIANSVQHRSWRGACKIRR